MWTGAYMSWNCNADPFQSHKIKYIPQNGTRTRHVLLKQSQSQFKKFQQGPENFVENLGNDLGGTGGEENFGLFFWPAIIRKK